MVDREFETNLLRLVAAEAFFLCSLNASREMYGKSYFSLGVAENQSLDQQVLNQISGNLQALKPEWFGAPPEGSTLGFHHQAKTEVKKD